ncbi:MAG: hypothetical protein K0U54_01400, partial [Bacteroidetes bacterium]|nr:hypothetical protein [Bacteroidota bacterium]
FLLGSRAGNIVSFSPKNRNFTVRYKDDLNAGIASLLFQGDTWWINTFNGLVAYNINDSSNVRISENDGLSNNEGNRYSAFDTGNGFLMGAIRGLNLFNPNELMPAKMESSLVLLKMKSYNALTKRIEEILNRAELDAINSIILPAEYKELQLDFALDQNIENREHSFRYKMNDENWVDINQEQSIRFPNLGAGKYKLQIEAIDFSGNIIGTPLRFNINSKNFFYKTWWFYLVLSLVGMGLVLYFLKQAQEKRKFQEIFSEKLLQSQEDERTRIAKDLHDSIGQQLTLIKRRAQEEEQGDISEMTHSALEEVRGISRNLYPSVLKQLGLSESIEQMIYDIDEKTNIFFTAEIEEIDSYFSEDASLNFYRFIQESITNILKHAEASSVSIIIKKRNGKVHISIKDDGKGFIVSETLKHHSLGLKTIAERIRILKGSFQIFSKLGEGTTIECELSIK